LNNSHVISKLPGAGTTIFTVMSRLAEECGAINLSQGFPDFDGPAALRERVGWHVMHGHNQYAPMPGLGALREAIAIKVKRLYGRDVDPLREVTVTPGATEALHCAVSAAIHAGDEAIVFDPAYDTYEPSVTLNAGVCRRIPLRAPDFAVDWDRVRAAVNSRTRLIILNTPHNPTGAVWSEDDMHALAELVDGSGILLLADEVYEHVIFDGLEHQSLSRHPELARRAFVVTSFGKTYHATGWRIGYCIAPPELTAEFVRIHQFINFSTNTPMQYALADFMHDEPEFPLGLGRFYQQKRDLFGRLLAGIGFDLQPCRGTFFQLADYSRISDLDDQAFAQWLTREHGVAVIPVSVFYREPPDQRLVRFCFAKEEATLKEAAERLRGV
jgi:methionine aminotransferase